LVFTCDQKAATPSSLLSLSANGESYRLKDKRKAGLLAAPVKAAKH
jgi:hypothetical protein